MGRLAASLDSAADDLVRLRADAIAAPEPGQRLFGLDRLRDEATSAHIAEVDRLAGELSELAAAVRTAAGQYAGIEDRLEGL